MSLLRSGAIGSVGASRAAIGGDPHFEPDPALGDADTLAYAFVHLLLEGSTSGQAMAYLRYGLPADGWGEEYGLDLNGYGWIGKLEFNLYGDPTVRLGRCTTDLECSDGTLCNGEGRCRGGYCVQGDLVDCSDLGGEDSCTAGRCDPATGTCSPVLLPEGTPCDDGLYCTVEDACMGGVCGGSPRACGEAPEGFLSTCDDDRQACLLEPESPPDGGPGPDEGEPDGEPGPEAPPEPPPAMTVHGGGGCTAAPTRARGSLAVLLRGLI